MNQTGCGVWSGALEHIRQAKSDRRHAECRQFFTQTFQRADHPLAGCLLGDVEGSGHFGQRLTGKETQQQGRSIGFPHPG